MTKPRKCPACGNVCLRIPGRACDVALAFAARELRRHGRRLMRLADGWRDADDNTYQGGLYVGMKSAADELLSAAAALEGKEGKRRGR